ncbi:MAG TPA: 2-oxo-4-hydroxy-4-carboxy-5-ureidoimidazoline decarboxylase [Cyclobacteriaceae bacterium]|nr:2-oxo-4-hydroxy-4-carboxy-5-ureidoimidazoline decarboxylase [Cyclobacteriaceae bacterium]
MQLDDLNSLPTDHIQKELTRCCGSLRWVTRMLSQRPFASESQLFHDAEKIWNECQPQDWLEAFSHHPKIGEQNLAEKFGSTQQWSSHEQKGMGAATREVLDSLLQLNQEYEKRFGYIFIVCATGKSAEEMLDLLKSRINNRTDEELKIAMAEQNKITKLRLKKLLS